MPLLNATRERRCDANVRRLRKLERLLDEISENIAAESDRLRDSFDSIAATAAFSMEAMENGDTNPWLPNQVSALGASLVWHSERLSSLREQGEFVAMAMGTIKVLMAGNPQSASGYERVPSNSNPQHGQDFRWTA
jgi:hypothetical protein